MSAAAWFAAGLSFIAIGIQQPAFIGIGAAFIAIGSRSLRNDRNRAP
ncbi:MAG: hypothetical protein JSS25_06015 [Proteobacteria bacterium]|nr:hypothetical protein [Pseudomonadota bacterium]